MLWEMLHIDGPLIVWLYVLRLQAFHKAASSASSYMCRMHRQGTQQLTLLHSLCKYPVVYLDGEARFETNKRK